MHGQLLLHGQGQQVGEVLAIGGAQLGTQQATTRVVGVNAQAPLVALCGAGTALVCIAGGAGDGAVRGHVGHARPHHRHVGVGEHDGEQGAAPKAWGRGGQGVQARNVAFIGRFVQQRGVGVGVARQKHRQVANLLGLRVYGGQAARIQRHAQRLQAQVFDVGHPAHRRDDLVYHHAVGATGHLDASGHLAQLRLGAHVQDHVLFQQSGQLGIERGIAQPGQRVTGGECRHLQAQPRQGLRQLHPDRSHADHCNAGAETGLLEQGVGGEHAVAKRQPFIGHAGA